MNELAIERNHQALKRLLALLFVYIGLADDTGDALHSFNSEVRDAYGNGKSDGLARVLRALAEPMTVSRRLHRVIWKLLRPVESATRYLIVALAGALPVPQLKPSELAQRAMQELDEQPCPGSTSSDPSPPCMPRLALLDPLRLKIRMRDADEVFAPVDPAGFQGDPAKANEQVSDAGLMRRIAALAAALDDLPRQARRLARWKARRDLIQKEGRPHRLSPLKPGRAPGAPPQNLPKSRWREEHHVLAETRGLAWHALRYPDTS